MAEKTGMVDKLRPIPPTLQFTNHHWRLGTLGGCAHNLLLDGRRLLVFCGRGGRCWIICAGSLVIWKTLLVGQRCSMAASLTIIIDGVVATFPPHGKR